MKQVAGDAKGDETGTEPTAKLDRSSRRPRLIHEVRRSRIECPEPRHAREKARH